MKAGCELPQRCLEPDRDRADFVRALVVFGLFAAIDGHAKKLRRTPLLGGRCRKTPRCDVIAVLPMIASVHRAQRTAKLAVAALGKKRRYEWSRIEARHWLSTADRAGLAADTARTVLDESIPRVDQSWFGRGGAAGCPAPLAQVPTWRVNAARSSLES